MTTVLRSARLDAAELAVQLRAGDRIERAERLVHQQDRRVGGQRARHADALPLTARQLQRRPVRVGRRRQADQAQHLRGARARCARASQPSSRGTIADVLRDGHVRKEADLLQHVADAAGAARTGFQSRVLRPSPVTVPAIREQQRLISLRSVLLPAPLRPDQRERLPGVDVEIDAAQNLPRAAHNATFSNRTSTAARARDCTRSQRIATGMWFADGKA